MLLFCGLGLSLVQVQFGFQLNLISCSGEDLVAMSRDRVWSNAWMPSSKPDADKNGKILPFRTIRFRYKGIRSSLKISKGTLLSTLYISKFM